MELFRQNLERSITSEREKGRNGAGPCSDVGAPATSFASLPVKADVRRGRLRAAAHGVSAPVLVACYSVRKQA